MTLTQAKADYSARIVAAADAETLGALYEEIVGYDPFADDPSISISEVRATLAGFVELI
jgi:hypothetical protein